MLLLALIQTSGAAFTPDATSEIWVDSGYVLDHPALGFGGGHAWTAGPARFGASAERKVSYLLAVDTLARTMARIEVPIGILTAIVGAPFFLWLLARGREGWS